MMTFLAPLLLLGLAALAVPIAIHLIQRERRRLVEFPSLMFVRQVPYRSVRRRRLRDLPLLLLRLAALLLIVAAFARPLVWPAAPEALEGDGPREVVIVLDRSFGMGHRDRWERARAAALEAIDGLSAADRVSLILFAGGASLEVRSTADRAAVAAAVDRADLAHGAVRYEPALKLAASLLAESRLPRREAILISGFQRSGWNRSDAIRLPPGATLTPVMVGERAAANVSVTGASLERGTFSGQERVTITAALANWGPEPVRDLPVTLEVDGRELQTLPVSIDTGASASVAFEPFTLTGPAARATLRAAPDLLPQDDAFHLVVEPGRRVPVLIVERAGADRQTSLYLSRALGIGDAPAFDVRIRPLDALTTADIETPDLVVLNDVTPPAAMASRLARFVGAGGGLLVALGEHGGWPAGAPALLPGVPGGIIDRVADRGAVLGFVDFTHPVFELFRTPRSGDVTASRFLRYRRLDGVDRDHILARFDDGAVALAARSLERGRVLVWTSTLDTFWNDLALKPVFLPFVHQTARHLIRYAPPAPAFTVGQVVDLAAAYGGAVDGLQGAAPFREGIVLTPSGRRLTLPAGDARPVLELSEQGFYEIRLRDDEGDWPVTVAANLDSGGSDLAAFAPEDLVAAVGGVADPRRPSGDPVLLTAAEHEARQSLWWYLLFAAAGLLAIEALLANRIARGSAGEHGDLSREKQQ